MGIYEDKVTILPNGIQVSKYPDFKKGEFREKYRYTDKDRIILYIGRIHESKGLDYLAKSFNEIRKVKNDVELVLCNFCWIVSLIWANWSDWLRTLL